MASKMRHASLTWKYGQAPRATAISNDQMDLYKDRIRKLYLDQNLSRKQVICRLEELYGFSISPDQFSKAANRWGFQKQPRERSRSTIASTTTSDSTSPENLLLQAQNDTPSSEKSQAHAQFGKRPRSIGKDDGYNLDQPNTLSSSSDRPAKRYKPPCDVDHALTQMVQILQDSLAFQENDNRSDTRAIFSIESNETNQLRPFPLANLDPQNDPGTFDSPALSYNSAVDIDKLCAEYLESCYLFKKAFRRYSKASIPFQCKALSSKERRSKMLDLARTATSRSTRKIVCVMLESELGASHDPLNLGEGNMDNWPLGDKMSPQESFLFHKHLARIYSYHYNKTSKVQEHLQIGLNFMKSCILMNSPQLRLDLWTLQHLLDGRDRYSIPDDLLDALGSNLVAAIIPCLAWCKKRLQYLGGSVADLDMLCDIRDTTTDPISISHWRLKWSHTVLWAHSNYLFAYLWRNLQIHPPAIDDVLIWLNEEFLAGLSTTQFLMIICRMIVDEARFFAPKECAHDRPVPDGEEAVLEERTSYNIPSCLMAIDKIMANHEDLSTATRDQFISQFRRHQEWATSKRRKRKLVKQVQAQMLQHLRSTIELMTRPGMETLTPPTPRVAPEQRSNELDVDILSLTDSSNDQTACFDWNLEDMMKRTTISMSEDIPSILMDTISERTSSFASDSTVSYRTKERFLGALQGNPPLTKPMVSRESYSSETSYSSSLQRFKAAGRIVSPVAAPFPGYRGSVNFGIEMPFDPNADAIFPPLMGVVNEDDGSLVNHRNGVNSVHPPAGSVDHGGFMGATDSAQGQIPILGRLGHLWRGR